MSASDGHGHEADEIMNDAGIGGAHLYRLDEPGGFVLVKESRDKDGKVTKEEFQKLAEQGKFAERLKDKPGALDKMFSRLDTNGERKRPLVNT